MVWQPGQSGNAGGRGKANREKLAVNFVKALSTSFELHGVKAIDEVIRTDPGKYLTIIASLMPKELEIKNAEENLTDEQLSEVIASLRSAISAGLITQAADETAGGQIH